MKNSTHKRMLAALLATTAVLALAGAATASAAVWKDGGVEVTKAFTLELGGGANYEIEAGAGALNCSEHLTLSSTGGSNASITKFESKSCMLAGTLSACTLTATEAIGLPWSITLGTESETVASMHIRHKFKGASCPVSEIDKTFNVALVPDDTAAIKSFEYFASEGEYRQFGSYSVEGTNSGTYGIG